MHLDPPSSASSSSSSSRKRKRKLSIQNPKPPLSPWRTPKQRQIYSSNLLSALRRLRPSTGRSVRATADHALAAASGGQSRWSRSILSNRGVPLLLKKARRPKASMPRRAKRSSPSAGIKAKARVLGRLVPGCRKLPLPSLLDEASDYIAALEVQVSLMIALADVLSRPGGGGSMAVPS